VGLIGGSGAKPITVLDLRKGASSKSSGQVEEGHEAAIRSAAGTVTTLEAHPEEVKQGSVDITTPVKKRPPGRRSRGKRGKATTCLSSG
jgi:hypothetical protein